MGSPIKLQSNNHVGHWIFSCELHTCSSLSISDSHSLAKQVWFLNESQLHVYLYRMAESILTILISSFVCCLLFFILQKLCLVVAVFSHYLWLCVFFWMLAQGVFLYMKLRLAVRSDANIVWFCLIGWGKCLITKLCRPFKAK